MSETSGLMDDIMDAHRGIRPKVPVSTLERSEPLSAILDCNVLLKTEHLLPTGSFKIRGATNKLRLLGEAASYGVVTASTGNHGLAVVRAGVQAGVPVTVHVSIEATSMKKAAIEKAGASLVVIKGPPIAAERSAREQADRDGLPYISAYNDRHVIAGQGTVGVEIAEQANQLDCVFVAVGGGGLISGLGTALKELRPQTRIVGVWPENSPCMLRALQIGHIIDVVETPTLSDGTAGAVEPNTITFPICQTVIDELVTVTEPEIIRAMRLLGELNHWMVEGAAGVALAGLIARAASYRAQTAAVVICGRNISLGAYALALASAVPLPSFINDKSHLKQFARRTPLYNYET